MSSLLVTREVVDYRLCEFSVEKRFGRVLGPTVALVRPTTLSCPTPVPHSVAITSSKLQAAAAAASSSFPPVGVQCTNGTSSIVSAVASGAVPIVDAESASTKEVVHTSV